MGTDPTVVSDAVSGLRNLGYREADARSAVRNAIAALAGRPAPAEAIVVEALRLRGASLARETSPRYGNGTVHVDSEAQMTAAPEVASGAAHVGSPMTTAAPELPYGSAHVTTAELPAWLRDFLRRALAGDRSITVPIRVPARVV